uniref:30S ribosomal protein S9 n=1 Tax=uncultured korarchaeote TaxID=161241 RepID=A0A1L2JK66_9CREN|nr:ribosomal protein S9 [uncultured korarchaeote]
MSDNEQIKTAFASAKRKTSKAFVTITPGSGRLLINSMPLNVFCTNRISVMRIQEPLLLIDDKLRNSIDIKVKVKGGGFMSQADAIRTAIAKAIVRYTGSEELKKTFIEYDRHLLVEDPRRTEPKKYGGPSARARVQKSYR